MNGTKEAPAAEAETIAETNEKITQSPNICLKGKCKMVAFPNSPLQKPGIKPLNTRLLLILFLYYVQIRTVDSLMMYFLPGLTWIDLDEADFTLLSRRRPMVKHL